MAVSTLSGYRRNAWVALVKAGTKFEEDKNADSALAMYKQAGAIYRGSPLPDYTATVSSTRAGLAIVTVTCRGCRAESSTASSTGFPLGGNAVVVLNSELRVAVFGDVQAVGFFDIGNVFRRVSDLDLTDLRRELQLRVDAIVARATRECNLLEVLQLGNL